MGLHHVVMEHINQSKVGNILLGVMVMIVLLALIAQKQYRVKVQQFD